jgi:hypothetical protein
MQPRMKNPAVIIPDAMTAIRALNEATTQGGVPQQTLDLVRGLAALLLWISVVNVFNRVNVATRQVPGEWDTQPQPAGN